MRYTPLLASLLSLASANPIEARAASATTTAALPEWTVTNFNIESLHIGKGANQFGVVHYGLHVTNGNATAQCDAVTDNTAVTECSDYQVPTGFTPHACDGTVATSPWSWELNKTVSVTQSQMPAYAIRVAYDAPLETPLFGCTLIEPKLTCNDKDALIVSVPSTFTLEPQTSDECIFA